MINQVEVVDLHAHVFPLGLPDLARRTGDSRWPSLLTSETDPEMGEIRLGDSVMRVVRRPLWDASARLAVMDSIGVDVHVLSPMPIALTYWADSDLATQFARRFNDEIASSVEASDGRLLGLGSVPLQDPTAAIAEMHRVVGELGLHGVEIGTLIGGAELDDERLRPFFRAAAEDQVPIFVHPVDGGGATRCSSPLIDFAIGMHTDSSLAGYSLVYGGVLEELPDLRICLSHGGGSFAWTHPRLRIFDERDDDVLDALVARLWADALVFDGAHLPLLVERFGPDHLVLGSDYPFIPPSVHDPRRLIDAAVAADGLSRAVADRILGANARSFLAR